jgi:hypothetical protein
MATANGNFGACEHRRVDTKVGFLVEAAGVEPASENVTGQETTCLFTFRPQAFAALRRCQTNPSQQ